MDNNKSILLAIDFDHTLIDENSDLSIKKLAPDSKLPDDIEALFHHTGWTEYMASIFKYLHSIGIREGDMRKCMEEIPVTEGMRELLEYSADHNYETIIISDSNSVFIDMILKHAKMSNMITEVFTNPAYYDKNGCLKIERYHTQDWCDLSTVNLCKGHILQDYIQKRKQNGKLFDSVVYIGDGTNDLCPSLTLKEKDFVCPRINFRLWKRVQKILNASESESDKPPQQLTAQVINWDTGLDVLQCLKQFQ